MKDDWKGSFEGLIEARKLKEKKQVLLFQQNRKVRTEIFNINVYTYTIINVIRDLHFLMKLSNIH